MPGWRDELVEAVKSRSEREAEEHARHRKRVEEALATAEAAVGLGREALRFACERLVEKGQKPDLVEQNDLTRLVFRGTSLGLELVRESAAVRVLFVEGKPREFDFAKDRHITAGDVEEYVGRRILELVRAANKAEPW